MLTVLYDGDILLYKTACVTEQKVDWEGDGEFVYWGDIDEAKQLADQAVDDLMEKLQADRIVMCFTHSTNFRLDILPTYKANRADKKKPEDWKALREYLLETYESFERPLLEGDDCLGILATSRKQIPGAKVIFSLDKDMRTIPGKLLRTLEDEVEDISEFDADHYHMYQTLIGDTVDNYKGIPGIGPKRGSSILEGCSQADLWPTVVEAYEAKGLTEADALVQAQVARICRVEDYDFVNRKPIPWTPK